jgi:LPXTG-motif cell wall-anchored protein
VRRLDTGETLATAEGFFSCPARQDLAIQVRSGSSYEARDVCAVAFFLGARVPLHGTVAVREGGFVYTPAPGYTGPDRFDYQCLTSESIFGTVRVTVLPAVAPVPTEPPPAPGLPATGTSGLPVQVAAGLVLVGLGILVHRRARRRPAGLS